MKINWPAIRFGSLLLAGAVVAVLPATAQTIRLTPVSVTSSAATITGVEVERASQQTTVRITGSGDLRFETSRLESPARLVLDFAEARIGFPRNRISSDFSPVLGVRLGQPVPGQSRVVIDLAKMCSFTSQADASGVTVSFADPGVPTPTSLRPARPQFSRKTVSAKAPDMPLPSWLTGRNFAFASPATGPVAPVAQNAPGSALGTAAQEKKYTGEPISVNLKDVDLKDFFRLIHEISGLNVVLDPTVHGTVTLVLDDVPWDQGLDIVLRNNGLAKEIEGNVLRITTQDSLKHEADQRRDLLRAETEAIEPITVTRVLSYAQAPVLMPTIKKFLTARGDVLADIRSNTLIIKDIPSQIPKIDDLVRQLDRKSQQVEIDARIVQTSRTFAREIGTQFGFTTPAGNTILGGLVGNTNFVSPLIHSNIPALTVAGKPGQIPLNTNLPATAPNSGLTFTTQGHNYAVDFILSLMESRGVGKILSEPKGITQNNQKLTVKQGSQVPVQTTINNTISVQYLDATLKLEVTPQITSEGTVYMDINVENTQIDKSINVQGNLGLDTQSTQTKVLVNDGGTVVIGGVVINNQTTTIDQVPLLGNLPLIGNLFKHTSISVSTQELMFFVTPRILPT